MHLPGIVGSGVGAGFRFGLLLSAFGFGFRHGIDWDHIAAITDITSSQDDRRLSILYGTIYALGHALVVFALGVLAIVAGNSLPSGIDAVMARIVGATLLVLGVYVFVSLIRHGRDFRLRSRWMLVFAGVRRGTRWMTSRRRSRDLAAQPAPADSRVATLAPDDGMQPAGLWHHGHHGQPGHHHHERPEADDIPTYGGRTAFGVGMIHGVGAETATQVLLFLGAARAGSPAVGVIVLMAFIVGLLCSNSVITVGSTLGVLSATKNFALYVVVAVVIGVFSLVVGTIFLFGAESLLPKFFGG
ncbi:MAG: hypothetical protein ACJ77A_03595 [Actinomycetota bacterium]